MKNRSPENETLDAMTRRIFGTEQFDPTLVDRATSDPQLFTKVLERIVVEQSSAKTAVPLPARFTAGFVTYAGVSLSIALAFGSLYIFTTERQDPAYEVPVPVVSSRVPDRTDPESVVRPEVPPQPITGKLSAGRTTRDEFKAEKAIYRPKTRMRERAEPVNEDIRFYPIAHTGDATETSAGTRIVRVDLKRSSLFALGVDLPLENDAETVKADILVGTDGVMRGVRVVN